MGPVIDDLKIFSGNAHKQLAQDVCDYLNIPLGKAEVFKFANDNTFTNIQENVRQRDVFIVQPITFPVNDHLMELLIMIDACKRASAGRITAVVPYYGYGRTDKKDQPRVPITARLVADLLTTAGNAAGAVAAYAARSGHPVKVYMPQDAPSANKKESLLTGAELNLVDGLISDAGRISSQVAKEENLFDLSTLKEPYRAEGKKTMALELAQQLGWKIPDVIVYPTGGGTGIIGMHKGFNELLELGWVTGKQPRFIAVQAEGCQPIVKAFNEGADSSEMWTNAATVADGLRVPGPFADYVILKILRETGGTALSVTDKEMVDAMYEISSDEGVVICPEGAATLVGLRQLLNNGLVSQDETVILLNTGSAYKYLELVSET